jgi:hypothetical protein
MDESEMKRLIIVLTLTTVVSVFGQDRQPVSIGYDSCIFSSTGQNTYFILQPGYQLVLEAVDDEDTSRLVITVLNETQTVNGIETRVVEENESENGKTIEISRNFYAYCERTGDMYYFGEEVDIYKDGKIVSHGGAWLAEGDNKPGIIMPGEYKPGARYYQEIAPGIAMDWGEIISTNVTYKTPFGTFTNCLKTMESTDLNPEEKEYKHYAPGIGLIQDENLKLVKYRHVK